MKKITDRFLLGVMAGLCGNIAKIAFERLCVRAYGLEKTGAKKAAGIFLKKGDINTLHGRFVGNIADSMIACGLEFLVPTH